MVEYTSAEEAARVVGSVNGRLILGQPVTACVPISGRPSVSATPRKLSFSLLSDVGTTTVVVRVFLGRLRVSCVEALVQSIHQYQILPLSRMYVIVPISYQIHDNYVMI